MEVTAPTSLFPHDYSFLRSGSCRPPTFSEGSERGTGGARLSLNSAVLRNGLEEVFPEEQTRQGHGSEFRTLYQLAVVRNKPPPKCSSLKNIHLLLFLRSLMCWLDSREDLGQGIWADPSAASQCLAGGWQAPGVFSACLSWLSSSSPGHILMGDEGAKVAGE